MRWSRGAIWWGGCAESPTGRFQLTRGENKCSKITNETLPQIHPQSITVWAHRQSQPRPGGEGWAQQKKSRLLRCGITRTRGFSPGLITGVNIKSRSHSLAISDVRLKRASGDFALAGKRVPGPFSSLLKCPSLPPRNPTVGFFSCIHSSAPRAFQLGGMSVGTSTCSKSGD